MAIFFALSVNLPSCNFGNGPKVDKVVTPDTPQTKAITPEQKNWLDGKQLFRAKCAACHNPKSDGAGPALNGVTARWSAAGSYEGKTGEQWLHTWIKNWHDVVNAKYKYGVDMANSRAAEMNVFSYLSEDDINHILLYVEAPDGAPAQAKK